MRKLILSVFWMGTIVMMALGTMSLGQACSLLTLEEIANLMGGLCNSYCNSGYTCGATQDCDIPQGHDCGPYGEGQCTGNYQRPESYSTCAYSSNPQDTCDTGGPINCSKIEPCFCYWLGGASFVCGTTFWGSSWSGAYYPCT
jgi:hypothetical protein